jgi:hypothetical protein
VPISNTISCPDAVKFWVFWTLQAVWVWVTLLPVMILNGNANNPSMHFSPFPLYLPFFLLSLLVSMTLKS